MQWSQSAAAQPYMQQARANLGVSQGGMSAGNSGGSGYGMNAGSGDQYGAYLKQMYDANVNNPDVANQYLAEYMNMSSPEYQQEQQYNNLQNDLLKKELNSQEGDINIAISYMNSGDPVKMAQGEQMLKLLRPDLFPTETVDINPYTSVRTGALDNYATESSKVNPDLEQMKWLDYYSKASDSQIDAYQQDPGFLGYGARTDYAQDTFNKGFKEDAFNPMALFNWMSKYWTPMDEINKSNAGFRP